MSLISPSWTFRLCPCCHCWHRPPACPASRWTGLLVFSGGSACSHRCFLPCSWRVCLGFPLGSSFFSKGRELGLPVSEPLRAGLAGGRVSHCFFLSGCTVVSLLCGTDCETVRDAGLPQVVSCHHWSAQPGGRFLEARVLPADGEHALPPAAGSAFHGAGSGLQGRLARVPPREFPVGTVAFLQSSGPTMGGVGVSTAGGSLVTLFWEARLRGSERWEPWGCGPWPVVAWGLEQWLCAGSPPVWARRAAFCSWLLVGTCSV